MTFTSYEILITEKHMDMFNHMNNAAYLELYEEARWEQITSRGFGADDIRRMRKGPVVLEANVKFMREVLLREKITITTQLIANKGKIQKLFQQMIKADGTVASEATFTFGLLDLETRKLIDPIPEWKVAIGIDN